MLFVDYLPKLLFRTLWAKAAALIPNKMTAIYTEPRQPPSVPHEKSLFYPCGWGGSHYDLEKKRKKRELKMPSIDGTAGVEVVSLDFSHDGKLLLAQVCVWILTSFV